jgi:xanthine/uracil permease
VLIVGFTLAAALVPVLAPALFKQLPEWSQPFLHSSVVIACLVSVLLNATLNGVSVPDAAASKSATHSL